MLSQKGGPILEMMPVFPEFGILKFGPIGEVEFAGFVQNLEHRPSLLLFTTADYHLGKTLYQKGGPLLEVLPVLPESGILKSGPIG